MAIPRQWTCVECGKSFSSGEWSGCRGDYFERHKVERRSFWNAAHLGCQLMWTSRYPQVVGDRDRAVTFKDGRYDCTDPETIEFLENYRDGIVPLLQSEQEFIDARDGVDAQAHVERKLAENRRLLDEQTAELNRLRGLPYNRGVSVVQFKQR